MPRRYPRLHARDREGHTVSIPLSIAPLLLANEEFVSLPQRKVNEIAEANERVRCQEAATTLSPKPPSALPEPDNESAYKADDEGSLHENVGSSITGTVTPERSSASSSQTPVREVSTEKTGRGKKRVRRLWTTQEDEVVLCAVLRNETGPSLIGRLPNRSRSAVLKRFYVLREKLKNDRRAVKAGKVDDRSDLDNGENTGETGNAKVCEKDSDAVEGKIDDAVIEGDSNNDMDGLEGTAEDEKVGDDGVSLDEYESYDEKGDDEEDEDIDEDGSGNEVTSGIEDGYRPDEEMDEIPPLE